MRSGLSGLLTTLVVGVTSCALLSACGGSVPVGSTAQGQGNSRTTAQLRIVIPVASRGTSAKTRRPAYVSPSTASVSVSVDGGTPTVTNLSASSPACSGAGPLFPLDCNVPINGIAPGSHTLTIATYDTAGATGKELSSNIVTAKIVAGQANIVGVTLGGIPAEVTIGSGPVETTANGGNDALVLAGPLPKTMIVEALDADANVIVGPGAPTLSVTSSPAIVTAAAVPTIGGSAQTTNTFVLTPTALGTTTLTLTATQVITAGSGGTPVTVTAPVSTIVSPILGVANTGSSDTTSSITEYAPWSAAPALTITSGISDPIALAQGSLGTLYVLDGPSGAFPNTIQAYIDGGKTISRTITSGLSGPDAIAVDQKNGTLYVANATANTITEYAANSNVVARTITTGISGPAALSIDASENLYVANYTGSTVTVYAPGATTPLKTYTAGVSKPFGIVVNTTSGAVFVANLGAGAGTSTVTAYTTASGTAPAVTFTGTDFADATPLTTPETPIGIDTNGRLYAANYAASPASITTYTLANGAAPTTDLITSDVFLPLAVAIDNTNNLYVANQVGTINPHGTITVYAGGGQVNTRTLGGTLGVVYGPTAVLPIGP